jgi:phosphoglycolate phosphatase-like HAD superfamily hydrolase
VEALLRQNYGKECLDWFSKLYCADVVTKKKPAPDIYLLARDEFNLDESRCFVIEDSRNGLLAAQGAGMHCIITQSVYTVDEDFTEADIVTTCLGDPGGEKCRVLKSAKPIPDRGYVTVADMDLML